MILWFEKFSKRETKAKTDKRRVNLWSIRRNFRFGEWNKTTQKAITYRVSITNKNNYNLFLLFQLFCLDHHNSFTLTFTYTKICDDKPKLWERETMKCELIFIVLISQRISNCAGLLMEATSKMRRRPTKSQKRKAKIRNGGKNALQHVSRKRYRQLKLNSIKKNLLKIMGSDSNSYKEWVGKRYALFSFSSLCSLSHSHLSRSLLFFVFSLIHISLVLFSCLFSCL